MQGEILFSDGPKSTMDLLMVIDPLNFNGIC